MLFDSHYVNGASAKIICASETFAFFNHQIACWAVVNSKGTLSIFRVAKVKIYTQEEKLLSSKHKQGPIDVWRGAGL
jgi:hypothetical protein